MTTPDYPDWTAPVATTEQDLTVRAYAAQATGGSFGAARCGQYQSAILRVDYPLAGPAGERYTVLIQWSVDGSYSDSETITFHSAASYVAAPGGFQLTTPVRGTSVTVSLFGPAGRSANMSLVLSTRPVSQSRLSPSNYQIWPCVANIGAAALGAGATSGVTYLPPVDRAYSLNFVSSSATSLMTILGVTFESPTITGRGFGRIYGNGTNIMLNPLLMPRTAAELTWTNTGAAATNLGVVAWDVS